jgi:hypothetical protein
VANIDSQNSIAKSQVSRDEYQPLNGRYSSIGILEDCTTIFRFLSKQSLIKGSFYQNLTTAYLPHDKT